MGSRPRQLRELIATSLYVVDERAVADAVVARQQIRSRLAAPVFRSEVRPTDVRSFRRDPGARSFRVAGSSSLFRRLGH